MKKLFIMILVLSVLFSCNREPKVVTQEEAKKYLENYLTENYNQDFIITEDGRSQVIYKFLVMPKRYIGTYREKDNYYKERMHVKLKRIKNGEEIRGVERDFWAHIFLNEELENFLLPTLHSIFGKNIRPIMDISSDYNESLEKYFNGGSKKIRGKIFIFDNIQKDEDLKKYQEKIFEFLKYLESKEYFFRIDVGVYILDERILAPSFDTRIKEQLVNLGKSTTSIEEFLPKRKELMQQLDSEYEKMSDSEKQESMYKIKYSKLSYYYYQEDLSFSMLYHNILYKNIWITKNMAGSYPKPSYNRIEDIILYNSMNVYYEDIKAREEYKIPWKHQR